MGINTNHSTPHAVCVCVNPNVYGGFWPVATYQRYLTSRVSRGELS